MSEPQEHPPHDPDATRPSQGADWGSPGGLLKMVVAQGTFIAALLFYLGAMYTSAYYGFFHVSFSTLGLGFGELVTQSLAMLKLEVLVAAGAIVLIVAGPWIHARTRPTPSRAEVLAGRLFIPVVVVGIVLLALWTKIEPYGWIAPMIIAVGLLMSQLRDAEGRRPEGLRRRALPVFAAGIFAFWGLTQLTVDTAERDARAHARDVTNWTGVVVLSSQRLALPSRAVRQETLPSGLLHRYRYTGLRLLLERQGRYYVVPLGWDARRDAIYVIQESESVSIGLTPGTQPASPG